MTETELEVKIKEFSNQIKQNHYQNPKRALDDFFDENIREYETNL